MLCYYFYYSFIVKAAHNIVAFSIVISCQIKPKWHSHYFTDIDICWLSSYRYPLWIFVYITRRPSVKLCHIPYTRTAANECRVWLQLKPHVHEAITLFIGVLPNDNVLSTTNRFCVDKSATMRELSKCMKPNTLKCFPFDTKLFVM